jgi:isoleucyl-tRNA synthetase
MELNNYKVSKLLKGVPKEYSPAKIEQKILDFWEERHIFEKSTELREEAKPFVFLEGPPFANGIPHPGHLFTRIIKDVVLRYQTMKGYKVLRKAGWDTHGLPVEIEVEKELGLKNKKEVEQYGIAKFNDRCKQSVFRYIDEWVWLTRRIGFWIDLENPYITYENEYIESVWWSLKQAWEKGLLYRGYKVIPYCPRCETGLSTHEVAQGYKLVEDPSIYVKFRARDEPGVHFLAWTTTPWTLLSNVALAVNPNETYLKIEFKGEEIILAKKCVDRVFNPGSYRIICSYQTKELEGREYEPLYSFVKPKHRCWFIISADWVTTEEGTGIVHVAPAFGEEDYEAGKQYGLPLIQLVKRNGKISEEVEPWKGKFVKDADPLIIKDLKRRGLIAKEELYKHEYPFCWRCDSPLLYYACESWFIRISKLKEELLRSNSLVRWYPGYIKEGRFGEFIREPKDWALSRDRYWGTPLPIWTCSNCKREICVGSIKELREFSINFPEKLDLHKPSIDQLEIRCPRCNHPMLREPQVIDTWYDSGCAPFAQFHYPFENKRVFNQNFPADFITEAIDQTRGWFYSLLAISTFLFNKSSYKSVLVLELILNKEGEKMSKSKHNYVEARQVLRQEGADPTRWYLLSSNAPWVQKRFYEEAIREVTQRFISTLWNVWFFFTSYAELDKFDPQQHSIPLKECKLLDQWLLSRLNSLIKAVRSYLDKFELHKASRAIEEFVLNDLSNWWVRRSRKRFWTEEMSEDKKSGYSTLWESMLELSKLLAPFMPFLSEEIHQNLKTSTMPESVHLANYPRWNKAKANRELENGMKFIREWAEAGRALRAKAGIKIRYPLSKAFILAKEEKIKATGNLLDLLKEEINVKAIEVAKDIAPFMQLAIKPNLARLGKEFRVNTKEVIKAIEQADPWFIKKQVDKFGKVKLDYEGKRFEIRKEDVNIEWKEKANIKFQTLGKDEFFILDTSLTPKLKAEGFAKEIIRRIQQMRKEANLSIEDKIRVELKLNKEKWELIKDLIHFIAEETRSESLELKDKPLGEYVKEWKIDEEAINVGIKKIRLQE